MYSDAADRHLLVGRTVMYTAAYAGLVATIQYLKAYLVVLGEGGQGAPNSRRRLLS